MPHLLIYGDSNTHGTLPMEEGRDAGALGPQARWAGHLAAGLGAEWRVTVEGLPGRTTVHDDPVEGAWKNGATVLPAILQSHAPVDVVAIMLGTNDLKARFAMTASDIAVALERLLVMVVRFCPAARRMLICPPPVEEVGPFAEIFENAAARSAALASRIGPVAARNGAAFFDAGQVIAADPADGIHFGAEAHAALGRALVAPVAALK